MTPERWRQIRQLFHAASERAPAERAAFLDEVCAGDEALRREVESLLASHDRAGSFIEAPPDDVAAEVLADEPPQSIVGRMLGHYRLGPSLGRGGMGEVYLADDTRLGRKVALKLLPGEFTRDRERIWRFKHEARTASGLNHPNILTVFEIGEAEGVNFIVTEFVDGQTLHQRMAGVPLELREVLEIAAQIASALQAAHAAGIVHRDIKPENIMLRRDGYVKVLDFGLAKLLEPPRTGQRTLADSTTAATEPPYTPLGKVMGTPHYMSPEQVRGLEVDGRSDIFSFGVLLYKMATGRTPFGGGSEGEVMAAILSREAPPLQRYSREAPPELERIVMKALAKDREERYQGVKDLLLDLKNLKLELELAAKLKRVAAPELSGAAPPPGRPPAGESPSAELCSPSSQPTLQRQLEPVGGAVPLTSEFYIVRPADAEFRAAVARRDSVVLVKGARQVGKTSLLARGLQQAREAGASIVLIDFQSLNSSCLGSAEHLLLTLAELIADQLDLGASARQTWEPFLSPSINFERFVRRGVLLKVSSPVVWGMDEVDRLFTCDYASEVFGLFRSWHNKRALDPAGPWQRLTLVIAYATEAHLFITDLNQSPFNIGTQLLLEDFTFEQVSELNGRYGSPLRDRAEVARYFRLVGGHPYLVRRGLYEMAAHGLGLAALEATADQDEGPFGDHLRRMLVSLRQDPSLAEVARGILEGRPRATPDDFYRLRSGGLMVGDTARDIRPRCQLYATYLERHLL